MGGAAAAKGQIDKTRIRGLKKRDYSATHALAWNYRSVAERHVGGKDEGRSARGNVNGARRRVRLEGVLRKARDTLAVAEVHLP